MKAEMNTAEFVAITKPELLVDGQPLTPEGFIEYQARISSPKNISKSLTPGGLLRFLVENQHWSPFDMVQVTMKIRTTRAIMAQVLRHWSFRFQEFSQRYAAVQSTEFDHVEIRAKAEGGNRQGSAEVDPNMTDAARLECGEADDFYQELIKNGAAPESARFALPLATPTEAFITGSVRSWMTYFWQRLDSHAQKEHRDLALSMFEQFKGRLPMISTLILCGKPAFMRSDWAIDAGVIKPGDEVRFTRRIKASEMFSDQPKWDGICLASLGQTGVVEKVGSDASSTGYLVSVHCSDDEVRALPFAIERDFELIPGPKPGDRILFLKDLTEGPCPDASHPGVLYARKGEGGWIERVGGCKEGFWVFWDGHKKASFGAKLGEDFTIANP